MLIRARGRRRGAGALLLAALSLALVGPSLRADERPADPWAGPLAEAGLTPADVRLDPGRWRGGGRLPLPSFGPLWDDWRAVAPEGERLGRAAVDRPRLDALVELAAGALCEGTAAVASAAVDPARQVDLVDALCALQDWLGAPLGPGARERLQADLAPVPSSVQAAAARVLSVVPAAVELTRAALAPWGGYPPARRAEALALMRYRDPGDAGLARLERLGLRALLAAGALVGGAVEEAAALLTAHARGDAAPVASFAWSWDTPLGRVVVSGGGDDVHDGARTLLLLDAGGDDRYAGGASTARGALPVSVLIDVAGDDRYETQGDLAFGAGVLGVAALADLAGDDVYRARSGALGCGVLGVGLLLDAQGDDRYEVRDHGQGAGTAGLGLLLDRDGRDEYVCLQRAQAFGQARGGGLLVDLAGDDRYVATDDLVIAPAPQTRKHNTSLAQGCGFGRRAHPGDGRSLAGGLGLLVDAQGDDAYRCGVFGQGTAYWYALGFLIDLAGDDRYHGAYYAQAAAAHYAVAGLVDAAGDDRYEVSMAQAMGQGQDLSLGVLRDRGGDDVYVCPGPAMGLAVYNGIGVLQDDGGADVYRSGARSLGDPGQHQSRPGVAAFGLFLDAGGGADLPPRHPRARAGATWVLPGAGEHPRAIGVGHAAP